MAVYDCGSGEGRIEGRAVGNVLDFRYEDPQEQGTGTFRLLRPGKFAGSYTVNGSGRTRRWDGERGWDGVWDTTFGRLRLIPEVGQMRGSYEGAVASRIEGTLCGRTFEFSYQESDARGEGRFELNEDASAFNGVWRPEASADWSAWNGRRAQPEPGVTWLVVLEAHWQRGLGESEYAYGDMLREMFARLPHVRVRHRFFHDAQSLDHWCRELHYLCEPAILLIASHGAADGLRVHGERINTRRVIESLCCAECLELLHFSSCLVGRDAEGALSGQVYPVSGYTTSVDWGASALLEFTYLDLVLNRGLSPAQAVVQLPRLVSYAGDAVPEDLPYPAAGFRFFPAR